MSSGDAPPDFQVTTYVVACKRVDENGVGSPSFELAWRTAHDDGALLVVLTVCTFAHMMTAIEPINVGFLMREEERRIVELRKRLSARPDASDVTWTLRSCKGELATELARAARNDHAAKVFVGRGSRLARLIHVSVGDRLRRLLPGDAPVVLHISRV